MTTANRLMRWCVAYWPVSSSVWFIDMFLKGATVMPLWVVGIHAVGCLATAIVLFKYVKLIQDRADA